MSWCSEASYHSCGCKSRRQKESREAVVVISNDGKGDRPVESLDVKAPVDRGRSGQIRTGGRATWQAVFISDVLHPAVAGFVRIAAEARHFKENEAMMDLIVAWRNSHGAAATVYR